MSDQKKKKKKNNNRKQQQLILPKAASISCMHLIRSSVTLVVIAVVWCAGNIRAAAWSVDLVHGDVERSNTARNVLIDRGSGKTRPMTRRTGSRPRKTGPRARRIGARPRKTGPRARRIGARPRKTGPRARRIGARPSKTGPRARRIGAGPRKTGPRARRIGAKPRNRRPMARRTGTRPRNRWPMRTGARPRKRRGTRSTVHRPRKTDTPEIQVTALGRGAAADTARLRLRRVVVTSTHWLTACTRRRVARPLSFILVPGRKVKAVRTKRLDVVQAMVSPAWRCGQGGVTGRGRGGAGDGVGRRWALSDPVGGRFDGPDTSQSRLTPRPAWVPWVLTHSAACNSAKRTLKRVCVCVCVCVVVVVVVVAATAAAVVAFNELWTPWDNRNGWLGVKHQITYYECWQKGIQGSFLLSDI